MADLTVEERIACLEARIRELEDFKLRAIQDELYKVQQQTQKEWLDQTLEHIRTHPPFTEQSLPLSASQKYGPQYQHISGQYFAGDPNYLRDEPKLR